MNLADLWDAVCRARVEQRRPPEPGEDLYVLPLRAYLEPAATALLRRAVRALRRDHPVRAVLFEETNLADLIVDQLVECDSAPDLDELADRLLAIAQSHGPWMVSTPVANIVTREPAVKLGDGVVLWRALGTDWIDEHFGGHEDESDLAIAELLGDRLPRVTRWLALSDGDRIDTRVGAQLLTEEHGTADIALAAARSRTQYAIAVWGVMAPPEGWQLLPELGVWAQQPHFVIGQRYKRREHDQLVPRERVQGNWIRQWADYVAPDADTLAVPFAAMARLERRSSRALLSSALAYHQATRRIRFAPSERLRSVGVAIETLCDPGDGQDHAFDRWSTVADRLAVWEELRDRGYDPSDTQG